MSNPTALLDQQRRIISRQRQYPDTDYGFINDAPSVAANAAGDLQRRIYALLTGWEQFESTSKRQYLWKQAYLNADGDGVVLPDGLSSDDINEVTASLHDNHTWGSPIIPAPELTSPADGEDLPNEPEAGQLTVEITWLAPGSISAQVQVGSAAPENWSDPTAYDIGLTSWIAETSTTMDLPADGTTFYIAIKSKESGSAVIGSRYAVSITVVEGVAALHVEQLNAIASKQQVAAICAEDASENPSVFVELRPDELPVEGGEPGETKPIWLFNAPITGFWGITQEDTYEDNRYTVAKAAVSNAPPDAMTLTALTGDDAVSVTATNASEAESGTHGLPVGSYVYVMPERGDGDVVHYVFRSGGVGGGIGESIFVRYIHDADYDNINCDFVCTYKWNEYVKYVEADGTWYYLFKQTHDTDPTGS